ncbi:MAG: hypothetical protein LBM38_05565 [Clostridiales bacterium]|jgi:hypothetical protein|nr:hypothetical protein [Clostridiales bacterium]
MFKCKSFKPFWLRYTVLILLITLHASPVFAADGVLSETLKWVAQGLVYVGNFLLFCGLFQLMLSFAQSDSDSKVSALIMVVSGIMIAASAAIVPDILDMTWFTP